MGSVFSGRISDWEGRVNPVQMGPTLKPLDAPQLALKISFYWLQWVTFFKCKKNLLRNTCLAQVQVDNPNLYCETDPSPIDSIKKIKLEPNSFHLKLVGLTST